MLQRFFFDRPFRGFRAPKNLALSILAISAAWMGALPAAAANFTVEARPNLTFSPSNLTISVGDSVTFVNVGGLHNVSATGAETFRCADGCDDQGGNGAPASSWTFTRTFNQAGTVQYACQVHGGMTGVITVNGANVPGTLALSSAAFSRSESGGNFTVGVVRTGGDDGAVSVDYQTSDGSASAGSDYAATSGTLTFADNEDGTKSVTVPIFDDSADENDETLTFALSGVTGGATLGAPSVATLTLTDDDNTQANPGTLALSAASYQAAENAGTVAISVTRSGGSSGAVTVTAQWAAGSALPGSDFVPGSSQLTWANGETGSKNFTVTLVDDNLADGNKTVNITLQNPTGGAGLGTSSATLTLTDNEQQACVADAKTLCLGVNDRFEVKVMWVDFQSQAGDGKAVDIGKRDSGLFYFFDENNIEMLIKILDGCGLNQRYWLFYAATTNVGFHLMVRDTVTGFEKAYTNDLGVSAPPILDTDMEPCS